MNPWLHSCALEGETMLAVEERMDPLDHSWLQWAAFDGCWVGRPGA